MFASLVLVLTGLVTAAFAAPVPALCGKENKYIQLMEVIAQSFGVTNCWICSGPQQLENWPWVPVPLSPAWILSSRSEVHHGTGFWSREEKHQWHLTEPVQGDYCLHQPGQGNFLGSSKCLWTYVRKQDIYTLDCTIYRDRWTKTHVQCNDGTWIPCKDAQTGGLVKGNCDYELVWTCKESAEMAVCKKNNLRNITRSVSYSWGWSNGTKSGIYFNQFWSQKDLSNDTGIKTCQWKEAQQLWKCTYYHDDYMAYLGGPLGSKDKQYYPFVGNQETIFLEDQPALKGHYWICGTTAYTHLSKGWSGSCYIGLVRPKFFFLPGQRGVQLGVRLYDDLSRDKRSIDTSLNETGDVNVWGDTWPPERIIQTYGPATWAQNESWGYGTPIYILNRLIRLQATVEIITSQTARALDLLADQTMQTREAVIQHELVLDYLLAEEGGVCGKLNQSSCCLKIDDNGQVVKEKSRKAHVPVQTWTSPFGNFWMNWFTNS